MYFRLDSIAPMLADFVFPVNKIAGNLLPVRVQGTVRILCNSFGQDSSLVLPRGYGTVFLITLQNSSRQIRFHDFPIACFINRGLETAM